MFLFTVTKPGLRQAGALALCAVCLAGTVTAAVRLAGKSVAASATVQTTIENTQDIGTYFTGYGFEVDLSTAAVDKVKIPKKWDDSFTAFNQVVGESGLTLADYKGKRWKNGRYSARRAQMAQQTPTVCCWYIKQSRLAPTCWKSPPAR